MKLVSLPVVPFLLLYRFHFISLSEPLCGTFDVYAIAGYDYLFLYALPLKVVSPLDGPLNLSIASTDEHIHATMPNITQN